MRKLIILMIFIGIASASCDGRDRVYKSNVVILKEGKLLGSFSESITYIPETYMQVLTDTILSNGFHVKIKTYPDMSQSVLKSFRQDSINHKTYYIEFISDIVIIKNSIEIFNEKVDKNFLKKIRNTLHLENAIVKLVVDEYASTQANSVVLSTIIYNMDGNEVYFYNLIIDSEGHFKLKEVTELYAYTN